MSGILIASLPIAINIMPATIVSFRNSTLSEKIGISTISKYNYILTNIIFYFMILFLTSTWDFIWVIIFNSNHLTIVFGSYQETSVNWGGFLLALVISYLTYLIIGISIALIFKTNVTTQIVGSLFYILSLIFSGQIIPFFILDSQRALKIVSYISPFRYVTGLLQMSWNNYHDINGVVNGGLFNPFHDYWISINNKTSIVSLHTYDIWLCWFMPPFFMIGFIGLTSKCFKWRI
ncbi:MAG: ABC transporter permease [Mycoplasmataceae bacterium]|nr:ABC transporter permease [Mycoplasmataceae bacterium]